MGSWLSRSIFVNLLKQKDVKILMLGLDAVGKTTVLYKLKLGEIVTTIPTIGKHFPCSLIFEGMNVEQVKYKGLNMITWDVGGRDRIRPLWR